MSTVSLPGSVLQSRASGGWLAVSAPDEPLRLAVVGADEDQARARFLRSATRWLELYEAAMRREDLRGRI